MTRGCTCTPTARRWTPTGCLTCGNRPAERQLEPVLLAVLCGGTGLVLHRNQSGHATHRSPDGREWHVDYGVGNPPGGGGDYIGMWSPTGRYVEVEMKTDAGRLSPKQRARAALVARCNGIYAVVRSEADARELLQWLRGAAPRPSFVFAPPTGVQ